MELKGDYIRENVIFYPKFSANHVRETQNRYIDRISNSVPGQEVSLTEVDLGMDFKIPVKEDEGMLVLNGGVSGVWSRYKDAGAAYANFDGKDGGRIRMNAGLDYTIDDTISANIKTIADGLGADFLSQSISATLLLRF